MYQHIIKPILFQIDPEKAHEITLACSDNALVRQCLTSLFPIKKYCYHQSLKKEIMGLQFPNPVGLAAGFDKDGKHLKLWETLGFGFVEVGTITPKPQPGNPRPRLFRLPKDHALINRMGFNNEGADALARRLVLHRNRNIVIGGNIGKNKDTPNEDAYKDYLYCLKTLYDLVDYFVVNVSSPNTPGLRVLQNKEHLYAILHSLQNENQKKSSKPLLLKIAPDLNDPQIEDIIKVVEKTLLTGIILTNTTVERCNLNTSPDTIKKIGMGGLSGAPLYELSNKILNKVKRQSPELKLISVGGIIKPEHAIEKFRLGADLIQIYSGLIYYGPNLPCDINKLILNEYDIHQANAII